MKNLFIVDADKLEADDQTLNILFKNVTVEQFL
jgi:hypothetical protein